jgi:Phage stabilisation protein
MTKTPFFGPFDIMRSSNLADNQLINLRPEIVDTKDGKNVGALMGSPGLDLLTTIGNGPINGLRTLASDTLYAVSGLQVYSLTTSYVSTLLGSVVGNGARVSMIDNGTQLAIFTNAAAFIAQIGYQLTGGTIASSGYPLTGGTILSGGINYAIGDFIYLSANNGTTVAQAILEVTSESAGVVTGVSVFYSGIYSTEPTGFFQGTTSGIGSGFTLTAPTYGSLISGGINYNVGDTIVLEPSNGAASAAAIVQVAAVSSGSVTAYTIYQAGGFYPKPTQFIQKNTTGSGSGLVITSPTYSPTQQMPQITLPFAPNGTQTISATFQDGYGLIDQPGTQNIWQSLVDDISVWPVLNFAMADAASDYIMALAENHRLIYVIKQRTTEVWNDAGTSPFAFQAYGTILIEHGTIAGATIARLNESLIWLSQTSQGDGIVREVEGYTAKRISTHAVETLLAQAATLATAFAYTYQQEGHEFYVLTVPASQLTLVYDKTASAMAGIPMWHQWLSFNNGQFTRHWSNAFSFFNQTSVVGDYRNGNLYQIDLNTLTDNGTPRKWVRSWRALQQPVMQPIRFSSLQIDMQTGVGVLAGTNPQVMLEWSDDGGHTWSTQIFQAAGPPGATAQRVKFNRLGSTKRNSGLDRIFRLSSTDAFPVALIGAELDT